MSLVMRIALVLSVSVTLSPAPSLAFSSNSDSARDQRAAQLATPTPAPKPRSKPISGPRRLALQTSRAAATRTSLNLNARAAALEPVHFAHNSTRIEDSEAVKLAAISALLKRLIRRSPREVFLIEGHSDGHGVSARNKRVSKARAEAVRLALVQSYNVPAHNLTVTGYGARFRALDVEGPSRLNRRVTIRRVTGLLDNAPRPIALQTPPPGRVERPRHVPQRGAVVKKQKRTAAVEVAPNRHWPMHWLNVGGLWPF